MALRLLVMLDGFQVGMGPRCVSFMNASEALGGMLRCELAGLLWFVGSSVREICVAAV